MFMKSQTADIAIIGGGAAGLFAAISASEVGAKVCIFEKNKSEKQMDSEKYFDNSYLGKKLLITGKGRCNLTNDCTIEEFLQNVPKNSKFLFAAFNTFPPKNVMNFFENAGVPLKVERGRRVFPVSDKARDILFALKKELKKRNVKFVNSEICDIDVTDEKCILTDENKIKYDFSALIIATGGKSYPQTGSTGKGYSFAEKIGHTITEISPSLVPLESNDKNLKAISGLSLKNVTLKLLEKGKKKPLYSEIGEMLFTHFGVSGPLVLSASAYIRKEISNYTLLLDLKPGLTEEKLDERLLYDFEKSQNKNLENSLIELLPRSLIKPLILLSGLDPEEKINSLTKEKRLILLKTIKAMPISLTKKCPIEEAIITSGGVKVSEINPSTMQSKLKERVFFAGEIIDVDAFTGGYNLQIAFCTGYLAGIKAANIFGGSK